MSKRVPRTKKTENEGLIAVAQFANDIGWVWRPTPNDDYGFDGELEPVEDGEATGKIIKVQIKSGVSYLKGETNDSFYYLVSKDDLAYWSNANVPVLLVVSDPRTKTAYGVVIQELLSRDSSIIRSRHIPFNKNVDFLSEKFESKLIAEANDEEYSGRIFRRENSRYSENLHSNLLPVFSKPKYVYGAKTECRTMHDIRKALGERRKTPAIPSDGMLWTFADLYENECSLRAICDASKITKILRDEWADDESKQRLLVYLMNVCIRKKLAAQGLRYDMEKYRYYFIPENNGERRLTWQSLNNKVTRPVVYPHKYGDKIDYWVHWSARFNFIFFGIRLYLMVEPSVIFTKDGVELVAGEEMGRLSTSRSSHRYNRNVLGSLFFWREFLREGKDRILIYPAIGPQEFSFQKDYVTGTANFDVDGDKIPMRSVVEDIDEVEIDEESIEYSGGDDDHEDNAPEDTLLEAEESVQGEGDDR